MRSLRTHSRQIKISVGVLQERVSYQLDDISYLVFLKTDFSLPFTREAPFDRISNWLQSERGSSPPRRRSIMNHASIRLFYCECGLSFTFQFFLHSSNIIIFLINVHSCRPLLLKKDTWRECAWRLGFDAPRPYRTRSRATSLSSFTLTIN